MLGLVIRSLVASHALSTLQPRGLREPESTPSEPMKPLAILLITCTFLLYFVISGLVSYALLNVVGVLVMVEDVPAPMDLADEVDRPLLDPALPAPRWRLIPTSSSSATVTAGVRKTIKYLRAEAGPFAMFRGIGYFAVYAISESFISNLLMAFFRPIHAYGAIDLIIPIFTPVLLWRINTAWLHKVISKASQKSWYTRVREQKRSWTVKRAILLWAFCRSVAAFIPGLLFYTFVLKKFDLVNGEVNFHGSGPKTVFGSLGIFVLSLVLPLLLVAPATVVLVRIQASILPADDEGILQFDKALCKSIALESTNSNAASEYGAAGQSLTLMGAWRSFAWRARANLVKVYAKCYVLQIALTILVTVVVVVIAAIFNSS